MANHGHYKGASVRSHRNIPQTLSYDFRQAAGTLLCWAAKTSAQIAAVVAVGMVPVALAMHRPEIAIVGAAGGVLLWKLANAIYDLRPEPTYG